MSRRQPTIRPIEQIEELEQAVKVLCRVWEAKTHLDLINASTLWAMAEADNYVVGLFMVDEDGAEPDEMVGAAVAIRGRKHLHSHIVGVLPGMQGLGLGSLLKRHEADWAAAEGFEVIRWTFDPLVRRNAHFNLAKLHARVEKYQDNLYGSLDDGLNDGDETDRLVIEWDFRADPPAGDPAPVVTPGSPDGWDVTDSPEAVVFHDDGVHCLIPTPPDIESLRKDDRGRDLAKAWRFGVRAGFSKAEANGYAVTGFSPDGWYVLRRR
ncbi:GNAT family N-acetyltransferase [Actinoplanes missouriensis]|uniref:GNAT family N-acetyltransferase n=1 Tax=Actinoplanes missouriensis TaxID=1866 RepID=UPI0033CD347C